MSIDSTPVAPPFLPIQSRAFCQRYCGPTAVRFGAWHEAAARLAPLRLNLSGSEFAALHLLQEVLLDVLRSADGQRRSLPVMDVTQSARFWTSKDDMTPAETTVILLALRHNPALLSCEPLLGFSHLDTIGLTTTICLDWMTARPTNGALLPWLTQPFRESGDDLKSQLLWILHHWSEHLHPTRRQQFIRVLDELEEERRQRGPGPGPVAHFGANSIPVATSPDLQAEDRYSHDTDWMCEMVLVAKQILVWLDQLSNDYGRRIERLDQIPMEALNELVSRGFKGLWLIGLWERSPASRKIKRLRGNEDAEASAYALMDYEISEALGGEGAYLHLKQQADAVGLRLAADMVPNHTGIDSHWIRAYPERFVQLQEAPYGNYRFDGPDLSDHPDLSIHLEDGYWQERDAAVVFRRTDHTTGETRYIYHGNDGTQMPWNDTAQLDFLQPDVREAVIQAILGVARRFPVIRFDAAMTLARQHIQRLWHPQPGDGGAIPSRTQHGVAPEVFDTMVPGEFWREVVARVQSEVPETLLLAEAFWMMEGYFVRELGMHRVYNSAFMHMLRDEKNAEYRQGMKEILATNPGILERFVNFMNNPDEETAAGQFGTGDKYFGIATLMATLPGLPLFGHGQFEGYREKYGMEFKRAYGDEAVDKGLLEHHLRVITPLLEARHRFAGVRHFRLFDWQRSDGSVDENVFAYSNQSSTDGSSSLIIYNNAYETTMGTLHWSAPVPGSDGGLESEELLSAFSCPEDRFCALYAPRRDAWLISEQARLREQGLTLELKGYEVQVFDRVETFSTLSSVLLDQLRTTGQLWVDGSGFQQLSNPAVGLEQSACA